MQILCRNNTSCLAVDGTSVSGSGRETPCGAHFAHRGGGTPVPCVTAFRGLLVVIFKDFFLSLIVAFKESLGLLVTFIAPPFLFALVADIAAPVPGLTCGVALVFVL